MNISILATVALGQMPRERLEERVSPPKRIFVHFTLGIRENTPMTVTVREELFTITEYCIFGNFRLYFSDGDRFPVFYYNL